MKTNIHLAQWMLPYQYSHSVNACEDCERIELVLASCTLPLVHGISSGPRPTWRHRGPYFCTQLKSTVPVIFRYLFRHQRYKPFCFAAIAKPRVVDRLFNSGLTIIHMSLNILALISLFSPALHTMAGSSKHLPSTTPLRHCFGQNQRIRKYRYYPSVSLLSI